MANEKQQAPRPEGPERSEGPSGRGRRPDPEVLAKGRRRQFSAEYKLRIVEEADRCGGESGAVSALLRREGLYSSHLAEWREARRRGALGALKKPRGPQGKRRDPVVKENEQLKRDNARLRRELAQALTILEIQKSLRDPGDPAEGPRERRRRMIAAAEELAETTGVEPACRALGVPRSSLYRLRRPPPVRSIQPARQQPRALSALEKRRVLAHLHEERFVDQAPAAIYATLLEEGTYLCSIRTMYRILGEQEEVRERRAQQRHPRREPPRLVATAPNQIWTWDITKLAGPRKWTTFPLYVILDMFSRYVVAWMVAERETAALAGRLVREACAKEGIAKEQLTLHQDRGAPMTAKTFSQLLVDLDVLASYSRPRVSDDNPYSESHFKTVKYAPAYPGWFEDVQAARDYFGAFFRRYNAEHRHCGLGLMTPEAVHTGRAHALQEQRRRVLANAYVRHPERFVRGAPTPPPIPAEVWINRPEHSLEMEAAAQ